MAHVHWFRRPAVPAGPCHQRCRSAEERRGRVRGVSHTAGTHADDDRVLLPSDGILACVPSGAAPALATRFDQLVFSEDVRVSDESASTTEFLVVGAGAADTLASALALDASRLAGLTELSQVDWEDGFVARLGESVLPSFGVCAPVGRGPEIVSRLEAAGVVAMSDVMIESLRIQAGRPKWGVDMNEETIPLEAGLLKLAISTSKGCYVGQEIIIRVPHRGGGRVAKRLVTLQADPAGHGPAPRVPVTLSTEGRVIENVSRVVLPRRQGVA